MGGRSSSSNTTKYYDVTENTNENISGLDNASVYSDVGGNISILDGGAVRAGTDVAGQSLQFADSTVDRSLDSADENFRRAFEFGGSNLDYSASNLDRILDFGGDVVEGQNDSLVNTLSSINAANNNTAALTSQGQQNTIRTVAKYAVYSVAGFLAVKLALSLYKKAK